MLKYAASNSLKSDANTNKSLTVNVGLCWSIFTKASPPLLFVVMTFSYPVVLNMANLFLSTMLPHVRLWYKLESKTKDLRVDVNQLTHMFTTDVGGFLKKSQIKHWDSFAGNISVWYPAIYGHIYNTSPANNKMKCKVQSVSRWIFLLYKYIQQWFPT